MYLEDRTLALLLNTEWSANDRNMMGALTTRRFDKVTQHLEARLVLVDGGEQEGPEGMIARATESKESKSMMHRLAAFCCNFTPNGYLNAVHLLFHCR
jgi:hypothetical protein